MEPAVSRRRTSRSAVHFGSACGQREAKAPQAGMFIGLGGSKMEGAPRRVDKWEPSRGLRNGSTPIGEIQENLLAQPPLRSGAVAVADQQHPYEQFGINR